MSVERSRAEREKLGGAVVRAGLVPVSSSRRGEVEGVLLFLRREHDEAKDGAGEKRRSERSGPRPVDLLVELQTTDVGGASPRFFSL